MHRAALAGFAALALGAVGLLLVPGSSTRSQGLPERRMAVLLARDETANILTGAWGGDGVRLAIAGDGTAEFDFDCAHGSAPGPLLIASGGAFAWPGAWVRERGGPIRPGEDEDSHPAVYIGTLNGGDLRLRVTLTDGGEGGTYVLRQGAPGRIVKCL